MTATPATIALTAALWLVRAIDLIVVMMGHLKRGLGGHLLKKSHLASGCSAPGDLPPDGATGCSRRCPTSCASCSPSSFILCYGCEGGCTSCGDGDGIYILCQIGTECKYESRSAGCAAPKDVPGHTITCEGGVWIDRFNGSGGVPPHGGNCWCACADSRYPCTFFPGCSLSDAYTYPQIHSGADCSDDFPPP